MIAHPTDLAHLELAPVQREVAGVDAAPGRGEVALRALAQAVAGGRVPGQVVYRVTAHRAHF